MNVSFGYPEGKILFRDADFGITSKSRIVLLGENGNGKTTLVKLMLGELTPVSGEIRRNPQVRIALVNQHHADQIPLEQTPLQFMQSKYPGMKFNYSLVYYYFLNYVIWFIFIK